MVNFLLKQGANVNAKTKVKNFSLLAFAFYYEPINQALQTHTKLYLLHDKCQHMVIRGRSITPPLYNISLCSVHKRKVK